MYKSLLSLLFLFAALPAVDAQEVTRSQMSMSDGINEAFSISIDESVKFVRGVWKDYLEKFGRVKKNKQKEYVSLGASIPSLASRPVDLFAKFEKMGKSGTLMHLWVRTEDGYFGGDNEAQVAAVDEFLTEFAKEVYRTKVRQQMQEVEKKLKNKNRDLTHLIKNNERLHKNIESYKKKIQKAEEGLEKNEKEQEATKAEIEKIKKELEEVKKRLEEI